MVDRKRSAGAPIDTNKLDKVVAKARQEAEKREEGQDHPLAVPAAQKSKGLFSSLSVLLGTQWV